MLAWSFEPSVLLGLVIAAAIYVAGLREIARRGRPWRTVTRRRAVSFLLGLLAVLLALLSPIDTFADRLFALHMLQHLLLLMVAAPLLLLGKPLPVLLVGAPHGRVRRVARVHARTPWLHGLTRRLTSPLVAWPLYVGDIWLWHMPALYQLALQHEGVHLLEHLCFLGTGLLFWWVVIEPLPGPTRVHHGLRLLYAWAAVLPNTALGALFVFAGTPWYRFYAVQPRLFGTSVMDDQRLGGLIMWLPGDMMYVTAAALLFFAMLARDERDQAMEERAEQVTSPVDI
jgi:cytochrome c oxidase assembly factor CtaG